MAANRPTALLITQYYRPEVLGSGPLCADLAEWLVQRGWHVTVLAGPPHYPDPLALAAERENAPRREIINGVVVERVRSRIPKRGSTSSRIASEMSFFLAGLRTMSSRKLGGCPLVISLCPSIASVALGLLARRRGGRHVAIVHDIQSGLAKGLGMVSAPGMVEVMRLCERIIFNRTDMVAVLSEEMAEQLRLNRVTARIELLPVWVDMDRFAATVTANDEPPRIMYSGNFGLKQGLDQIVALAGELQRSRPDLRIVLRGNGNQADHLRQEIEARNLRNLRVERPLPLDALSRGLQDADIHLVPQAPDAAAFALPSKIFNIMAAGRPFVATALANSPLWRIQQATGAFLCVPPNDSHAFAGAVLQLVNNPKLRKTLGEAGRRFVATHNDRALVLEEFESRIHELYAQ